MSRRPLISDDPQQIGRYRILGELGSGGMGRVLLGTGPDGRLVAVKQVHPHLLGETEYRARFRREVAASTRVSGVFTAPVIDFDVDSATPWLASAFVVGMPLDKAVSDYGPLPPTAVRRLAAGLASALQAIHQAGLIHRDLKPANVMLAVDGPRVIDFGIASMAENPGGLTETGSTLGSPAYMSPEQTLSERLTPASDIFSLGSVLMMAATGTNPFAAASMAYTLFNIAHTQPNLASLPPELRELIEPCLHKDPAARPTPAQILDYLGQPALHELPWPEPVHREIDRQHAELVALTADPMATSILPGARRTGRAGTRVAVGAPSVRRERRRRTVALMALAPILAAVTAVTAAVVWVRGDGSTPTASQELTLAQLRDVDACAWLKQAWGESIPADIAQDFPAEASAWRLTPAGSWGCNVALPQSRLYVYFMPGSDMYPTSKTGKTLPAGSAYGAGQPILSRLDSIDCDRGVKFADHDPWGLVLSADARFCEPLDYLLERLTATEDIPRLSDSAASLASVDPCLLVDATTLRPHIGTVPDSPAKFSAHSCEWNGSERVEISTSRSDDGVDSTSPTIDLGNGRQLIAPTSTVDAICRRQYVFRQTGSEHEMLEVEVQGGSGIYETLCAKAEAIARTAVNRLPPAK
ncbi:serine/threonine-protein kinase [Nocardia sp. NPDC050406]|uniref:serine/threonine-protein kinase n=1 Tax=Nocardia sp. NPDC050406 TaxID=3364318 RepID=UPI00378E4DD2